MQMEKIQSDFNDLKAENGAKVSNSIFERMAKQMVELESKVAELQKDAHIADLKNMPKKDQRGEGTTIDGVEVSRVPNPNLFRSQFELFTEQMGGRFSEFNERIKDLEQGNIMLAAKIND